jgi:drug/metabolite transporter (DMT)-like permease
MSAGGEGGAIGGRWKTHAALLVVQLSFAAGAVEGKLALGPRASGGEGISPWALAMSRMAAAALFFQLLSLRSANGGASRAPSTRLAKADHARIALLSLLGIVVNQTLFLLGLRMTTAFVAALLAGTIPVFTALIAVATRTDRPSVRLGLGVMASFGGVVYLVGLRKVDFGALVIAANCLSYAAYLVLAGPTIRRLGAMTTIRWVFTWGAILFAPIGLPALMADAVQWSARGRLLVAFYVLVPTIIAYAANAWALGRTTAALVAIYVNLQPVLAALLQWLQLGVPLTTRMVAASAMIVAGLALVASRPTGAEPRARGREG